MHEIIPITDPDDPRLADYRQVRERDLVGRGGGFIAEGVVVLEKLIAAGRHPLRSVLVAENRRNGLTSLLARLDPSIPVFSAGQAVMDDVAGFHIHRGVLAAGTRVEISLANLLAAMPDRAVIVGLCGISNHDNMGGLFRNAAAFGANAVVLDETCCDPFYRKAIRVSVGAALTTPFARGGSAADLVRQFEAAGLNVLALSPGGGIDLMDLDPPRRCAVLLGAEGPGLPSEVLAGALSVRIPMAGGFDSLNVATTSGIVLNHLLSRGRQPKA